MERIKEAYEPTEEFIEMMKNKTWSEFQEEYKNYDEKGEFIGDMKKLRNDYHNRMKKTNLLIYFMDHKNDELFFEIEYLREELKKKIPKKDNIKVLLQELNDDCVLGCVS